MQSHRILINASILLVLFVSLCCAAPMIEEPKVEKPTNLEILFAKILKKQEASKAHRLINFISKAVPGGVDAPIPMMAEYETFKSDKSANFINDGNGHIVFRQYRRARLSDIFNNVNRRPGGK
ncbi:unnamed protein product [Caenorhabditis sp. 36 PRJEB53466]|nr:unnamed protein product [Caenorhabditis sp. 36 PRJEB53466]